MDIKRLAPWNWFNKEHEDDGHAVSVSRGNSIARRTGAMSPSNDIFDQIGRLLDRPFYDFGPTLFGYDKKLMEGMAGSMIKPSLDLGATQKEYSVSVEIPGVEEKDVRLEITGDTLTISGEKKQLAEEKGRHYYRMERSYGSFQRVLSLPEDADQDGVRAVFKKGILKITIPRKVLPASLVKQIEIKTA
ncbi:MAG: Hsp20/alpha crystallin family protein [Pseudomonadota bacterium]